MIKADELRPGNFILHKVANKISRVPYTYQHFELLQKGEAASFFPIVLQPQILEQCGFAENMDYPLLPEARAFYLTLPVPGNHKTELQAYVKNNKECFCRLAVNNLPASNNIYHLHRLQNLYFEITGEELFKKK